jgi:hypothetical protein
MLELARSGIERLVRAQRAALDSTEPVCA